MPNARVSVDAEGLPKSTGYTVYNEDLPHGISGRAGLEALDRIENSLCQMKDYSFAALHIAEGRLASSIENERMSAIYTLLSDIRANIRTIDEDFRSVACFCGALCKRIEM